MEHFGLGDQRGGKRTGNVVRPREAFLIPEGPRKPYQQATAQGQSAGAPPPPGGQAGPPPEEKKTDGKAVEDATFEVMDDKDKK